MPRHPPAALSSLITKIFYYYAILYLLSTYVEFFEFFRILAITYTLLCEVF